MNLFLLVIVLICKNPLRNLNLVGYFVLKLWKQPLTNQKIKFVL